MIARLSTPCSAQPARLISSASNCCRRRNRAVGEPGGAGAGRGDRRLCSGVPCWAANNAARRNPAGDLLLSALDWGSCSWRSTSSSAPASISMTDQRVRACVDGNADLLRPGQHGGASVRTAPGHRPGVGVVMVWESRSSSGCNRSCSRRSACPGSRGGDRAAIVAPASLALGLPSARARAHGVEQLPALAWA